MTAPMLMLPDPQPRVPQPGSRHSPLDDNRVILHFDYDCFYASVFENENPSLKSLPLGVKQKSILATCNYVARGRGVKKLMLITEAQRLCPDLVLMNGEDLTRFRNVSKKLWRFLRDHSWNNRVERLGLDEVFMDVTDIVAYNQILLNPHALKHSFFQLSDKDPEKGFSFDATQYFGSVQPASSSQSASDPACQSIGLKFILASHLAGYLRRCIEDQFGYTSSGGVATNKTLAKMVGSVNKPKNQTTMSPLCENDVQSFVDSHNLRKVPGIGFRTSQLLQDYVLSIDSIKNNNSHDQTIDKGLSIADIRTHPNMSRALLNQILERPGAEKAGADKIWNLFHGIDTSEVKEASDVPAQISIEDTYMSKPLNSLGEILRELRALSASLIRRLRVDLTEEVRHEHVQPGANENTNLRWTAHPRTLRLSTRCRSKPGSLDSESFSRNTRSQAVPTIIYNLDEAVEAIAERLVQEALLPMFKRLNTERQGWNLALINICVSNMAISAGVGDGSAGIVRDISHMFRTQKDKLKEFTVYDEEKDEVKPMHVLDRIDHADEFDFHLGEVEDDHTRPTPLVQGHEGSRLPSPTKETSHADVEPEAVQEQDPAEWEDDEEDLKSHHICEVCHYPVPEFALAAHQRFHAMA